MSSFVINLGVGPLCAGGRVYLEPDLPGQQLLHPLLLCKPVLLHPAPRHNLRHHGLPARVREEALLRLYEGRQGGLHTVHSHYIYYHSPLLKGTGTRD